MPLRGTASGRGMVPSPFAGPKGPARCAAPPPATAKGGGRGRRRRRVRSILVGGLFLLCGLSVWMSAAPQAKAGYLPTRKRELTSETEPATVEVDSKVLSRLDEILAAQQQMLTRLDEVMEELKVIKARATTR